MSYLIIMAGLPGTGKTTTAQKLAEKLGHKYVSQNDVRREHGMKEYPKSQALVQRDVDRRVQDALSRGEGIIIDASHRYACRRHQLYGVASGLGKNVVVLECVCSEAEAKRRITQRAGSDGLVTDANVTKAYDEVKYGWKNRPGVEDKPGWQSVTDDLYDFSNHVSCAEFDTETNEFKVVINGDDSKLFLEDLERILKETS